MKMSGQRCDVLRYETAFSGRCTLCHAMTRFTRTQLLEP